MGKAPEKFDPNQQTLNSVFINKNCICDVIADIQRDAKLKKVHINPDQANAPQYGISLEFSPSDPRLNLVNMMQVNERYLVMFDPRIRSAVDEKLYEEVVKPAFERLREILESYAKPEVQRYLSEKSSQESS